MKIGDKFILVNRPPYTLWFGHNNEPVTAIEIEVIESKDNVPGEFTGEPRGTGYLAKGSDGYFYGLNWSSFNESLSDSCWVRWCSDEDFNALSEEEKSAIVKDYIWSDVTRFQAPPVPSFVDRFPYLHYCEEHQQLYYDHAGCWRCKFKMGPPKVTLNREEHSWPGWYDGKEVKEASNAE